MLTADGAAVVGGGAAAAGLLMFVILAAGMVIDVRLLLQWRREGLPVLPQASRLRHRPWHVQDALHIILAMAVLLAALVLAGKILSSMELGLTDCLLHGMTIVQNVITHGAALVLVLYLARRHRASLEQAFGVPASVSIPTRLRQSLYGYLAVMPLVVAAILLSNLVFHALGLSIAPQPVIGEFINADAPFWFIGWLTVVAIILAPVSEELVFRGVFLPAVARWRRLPLAVAVVSLGFALMHAHPPALLPLFVVGIATSIGYLHTGSILIPVLMHAIFNAVNLAVLFLTGLPG